MTREQITNLFEKVTKKNPSYKNYVIDDRDIYFDEEEHSYQVVASHGDISIWFYIPEDCDSTTAEKIMERYLNAVIPNVDYETEKIDFAAKRIVKSGRYKYIEDCNFSFPEKLLFDSEHFTIAIDYNDSLYNDLENLFNFVNSKLEIMEKRAQTGKV